MITEQEYLKAKQIVQEYEKEMNISDVIKILDELISKEDRMVKNLALDKMFKGISDCELEKLTEYKYRVSALKDFRNSLQL